jgi:uncharacterized protein
MKDDFAFWDSSALVPLCCQQANSSTLRQVLRQHPRIVTWWSTVIEAHSALTRLQREGLLTPRGYVQAVNRLARLQTTWREILPSDKLRDLAIPLPKTYELRAMDAQQLAAALVWCWERPKGCVFICLDLRLSEAARKAGFTIVSC